MKTTCLINNYNYAAYISDAIDSAVDQTVKFDEIIIVDDGSTDISREKILSKYEQYDNIKYIFKDNGGQMSAFNLGYEHSSGDLICFLDSDDLFNRDYLERTIKFINNNPACDFLFCAYETFGRKNSIKLRYPHDRDLGITLVKVNHGRSLYGVGGPTSTLAMRRKVAEKILPYPYTDDWRIRADDVLALGASLVGARKYFHSVPLVRYRLHAENGYSGRKMSVIDELRRDLAINRLVNHYRSMMGYDTNLSYLACQEFDTNPHPDIKSLKAYYRIIRDGVNKWPARLYHYYRLLTHYVSTRP
jgi:glycosyltransferase involved in cell wall biosynthesis